MSNMEKVAGETFSIDFSYPYSFAGVATILKIKFKYLGKNKIYFLPLNPYQLEYELSFCTT